MDFPPEGPLHFSNGQNRGSAYIASKVAHIDMRGGTLHPSPLTLNIATWKVEYLTDAKLSTLQHYMDQYNIHIICMQEVRRPLSDYFFTDTGFLVITSGGNGETTEYAGVGFLIHPTLRRSICKFCQHSNRIACLKVRITGGKIAIFSCYAPHQGKPFEERFAYFQELSAFWQSVSVNGPRLCFGDFNSRLNLQLPGEEDYIGPHVFGKEWANLQQASNRFLA